MTISSDVLWDILERSLSTFLTLEAEAVVKGVSERNHCGRMAMYMPRWTPKPGH